MTDKTTDKTTEKTTSRGDGMSAAGVTTNTETMQPVPPGTLPGIGTAQTADLHMGEVRWMFEQLNEKMDKFIRTIEHSVQDNSDRIIDVENVKIPQLRKEIQRVEADFSNKLLEREIHERKQNLLVYGIASKQNENVEAVVKNKIALMLNDSAEEMRFVNVHRLPRRHNPTGSDKAPEAIIVRFVRMADREKVLQGYYTYSAAQNRKKRNREGVAHEAGREAAEDDPLFRVSFRTDLPRVMKIKRSQLASKAYVLRKRGLMTRIRVVGTEVILQTRRINGADDWKRYTEEDG